MSFLPNAEQLTASMHDIGSTKCCADMDWPPINCVFSLRAEFADLIFNSLSKNAAHIAVRAAFKISFALTNSGHLDCAGIGWGGNAVQ
jgi:hypothetical protein